MAVADSYDTMTACAATPGRSARAARIELAACAGPTFDPEWCGRFSTLLVGRLRTVAGPSRGSVHLPFVSSIPRLGDVASALGRVGAATAVVGGAVAVGTLASTSHATVLRHGVQVALPIGTGPQATRTGGSSKDPQGNGTKTGTSAGPSSGGNDTVTGGSLARGAGRRDRQPGQRSRGRVVLVPVVLARVVLVLAAREAPEQEAARGAIPTTVPGRRPLRPRHRQE